VLLLGLLACVDYGVTRNKERDSWTQPDREGGVDILWVVDDSLSMFEEQEQLAEHAGAFVTFLTNVPVDFRLAVVSTDMDAWGGLPLGPTLSPDTEDLVFQFANQVTFSTEGSREERGFDAALVAADPDQVPEFARFGADLEVVFFTDEDDKSDLDAKGFLAELEDARAGDVVINAIVGDPPAGCASLSTAADPGDAYIEATELTEGARESICSLDYSAMLERVALRVLGMQNEFALTKVPELDTVEVRVDGVLVHQRERHGWQYDAGLNLIRLDGYAVPPPGSGLDVRYYEWYGAYEDAGEQGQ
jgi:hypothetical protein